MKHHVEQFQCANCRIVFEKNMYSYTVRPKFCSKRCYMVILKKTRYQQRMARQIPIQVKSDDEIALKVMVALIFIVVSAVFYVHVWCR